MSPDRPKLRWWAVLFWLFLWQIGSRALDSSLLLPSPGRVLLRLGTLCRTLSFWQSVFFSLLRIIGGFLTALLTGALLAGLSCRYRRAEELLAPAMLAVKTVPVASFIILALLWVSTRTLSLLISFLIALPVIYTNLLTGLRRADPALLEMAKVFRLTPGRRLRFLLLPALWPDLTAACSVAAGLCWKAGIAAEIIGIPSGSIGAQMQQAKVYLETPDLFAWTLTVVLLSALFEKVTILFLERKRIKKNFMSAL